VFSYLGLTFFSYVEYEWSYHLFLIWLVVILVGRIFGTFGLLYTLKYVFGHKPEMTFKEVIYLWYAGLIRGAIAFGLVLRIDEGVENRYLNLLILLDKSLSLHPFLLCC
jgi:NhaP-type Na+/H+ or K+/H+ antiporter